MSAIPLPLHARLRSNISRLCAGTLLSSAAILGPAAAGAQQETASVQEARLPESGTRIRVRADPPAPKRVAGTLVDAHGEALTLVPDGQEEPLRVPLPLIQRLEVSRGHSRNTLRGLGMGAGIGAAAGLTLGLVARGGDDNPLDNYGAFETGAVGALGGATLGGLIGLAIGSFSTSERWAPLVLPRPGGQLRSGLGAPDPIGERAGSPGLRLGLALRL